MKQYIGTKLIEAEPAYRCMDERGNVAIALSRREALRCYPTVEEGYRVRYQDGYESWSPRGVFEEAYRPTDHLSFGLAIEAAKKESEYPALAGTGKGNMWSLHPILLILIRLEYAEMQTMRPSEIKHWRL